MELIAVIGALGTVVSVYLGYLQYRHIRRSASSESSQPQLQPLPTDHSQPLLDSPTGISTQEINEPSDFDDKKYREWLRDETGFIDIRGIGVGSRTGVAALSFPIAQLYTDLYVQRGLTNLDLDQGNTRGEQRIPLTVVLKSARRVVIMGDPGSGKTTFLRYVAHNILLEAETSPLSDGIEKPLPFYISLLDLYQYIHSKLPADTDNKAALTQDLQAEPKMFIDYLLYLSKKEDLGLNRPGLEKRLIEGRALLLLDSLDELPSDNTREVMVGIITMAARRWRECQFVITSRPLAVTINTIPPAFEVVGIDSMQSSEIRAFLDTWVSILFQNRSQATQREYSDELYATIKDNPQLKLLAKNPVMLTSMAVVHYNEKHLPEGRANLLEAVIYWLIHAKGRPTLHKYDKHEFIEERYRELALAMFEDKGGRKIRVGRQWAAGIIAPQFAGQEAALEFLNREETETGLLVRRGEGDLAFWLLWFQEYLAAKEIAGKTDDEDVGWWSKIKGNLDNPDWREVLSLVPACLNRLGSDRVDLFFERLGVSCRDCDFATKIKRVGLGGHVLRDLLLSEYYLQNAHSWTYALNQVLPIFISEVSEVKLEDRYEAALAYGLGGDNRLYNFEETWVPLLGGHFLMGAQAEDAQAPNYDPDARPWEAPVVEVNISPFEIRRYLITVKEYEDFILDGGYDKRGVWTDDGWIWRTENRIERPGDWQEQIAFPNCPITAISWFEASAYCQWLNQRGLRQSFIYRLPSEAEWEYALCCKLPGKQRFPWGNRLSEGDRAEANWAGCNLRKKTPVGMFPKSNTSDGVADMIGNVEEWCADSWSPDHSGFAENAAARVNPNELRKVVRGGSTIRFSTLCKPTYRSRTFCNQRYHTIGFRPVRHQIT